MITQTPAVGTELVQGAGIVSIQIVNLILLIATAILSARSFAAQSRASIRESIEQLDDVEYQHANQRKAKALLHRFSFGWADFLTFGRIGNPKTEILLKDYIASTHGQWASKTRYYNTDSDKGHAWQDLIKNLHIMTEERSGPEVELYAMSDEGPIFEINSRDPVEIRNAADIALDVRTR